MGDKEVFEHFKQQSVDSGQWTGDPESIKPPRSPTKQEVRLLLTMITAFFLDIAWVLLLKSYSPKLASFENGRVIALQMPSRFSDKTEFYVRSFEAYIHYALLTISMAALLVFLFRSLTIRFKK